MFSYDHELRFVETLIPNANGNFTCLGCLLSPYGNAVMTKGIGNRLLSTTPKHTKVGKHYVR